MWVGSKIIFGVGGQNFFGKLGGIFLGGGVATHFLGWDFKTFLGGVAKAFWSGGVFTQRITCV